MLEDSPAPNHSERSADGARVLAVALASVTTKDGLDAPTAATADARRRLDVWRTRVDAPESEVRRAGRRLAMVIGRLGPDRLHAALSGSDPGAVARALVDECGRWDRDFIWDVPLRDISRAIVTAAARAVREHRAPAHATGDIRDN